MLRKISPFVSAALFLGAAIYWDLSTRRALSDQSIAGQVGQNLDQAIARLETEASLIVEDTAHRNWSSFQNSFYLLDSGKITKWSKNRFALEERDMVGDYKSKLLQRPEMDLLLFKFPKGNLVGILPLRTGYEIENRYLTTTWNEAVFPVQGLKIVAIGDRSGAAVCSVDYGCLFSIQIPNGIFFENLTSLCLALLAVAFVLVGIYFLVVGLHQRQLYFSAFLLLFGAMAALRIAMVQFLFPGRWMYSKFFDPKYFASSSFNASIGDFFLNALIVAVASVYLFKTFSRLRILKISYRMSVLARWTVGVLLLTAAFFSFLFPHLFVESIFHDSAISLDITSGIEWNGIRIVAIGALLLGSLSSFFFVHILVRWLKGLTRSAWSFLLQLLVGLLFFVAYFLYSSLNYWPTVLIGAPFLSWLYFSRYFRSVSVIGYQTFSFLLIVVIIYGIQGAVGIRRFSEEEEIRSMFRSAGNLMSRDVLGEYLLNETIKKIAADKLIASGIADPSASMSALRQRVRLLHLNGYFDRYEVKINLYNAADSSLDDGSERYGIVGSSFGNENNKTTYEGIYFIRNTSSESIKQYIAIVPIKQDTLIGKVVLDISSKQIVPQQVYPELLVDNRFTQSLRNKNYSYAFYKQGKLVGSVGGFNFDRDFSVSTLNDPLLYTKGLEHKGVWIVGAEDDSGKEAIVSSERYPVFFSVANFSFLFVLGIGLLFLSLLLYLATRSRKKLYLNYSARIQLYIYLSFILPLVVVSTIALQMISQSEESQLEKEIKEKGLRITESVGDVLKQEKIDSLGTSSELGRKLIEASQNIFTDANLYGPNGVLLATSQPTIFASRLVMPFPDRASWEKIVNERFNIVQARCRIGLLEYNSLFFSIKPPGQNELVGILELPFFQSNSQLARAGVLANILVTFVIVFILFSFFAYNAMIQLTSPLRFIARKLKTTSLLNNQPIAWKANDEIGLMVKEYNRMLENLEQSKITLARVQKESAWREIAQQVAHEIKNPLTPMKLILQQLELTLSGKQDDDRNRKSVQMLLSQVETLNGIASSFSTFATMPPPVLKQVNVSALLESTVTLFLEQKKGEVKFDKPDVAIFVLGDEHLLGRIFSNIILNGLQSRENGLVKIWITLKYQNSDCIICFRDNGMGISQELRGKIFLPHFSTKKTGSGLGLAIAKQGIEQMGGAIWFETTEGEGSEFYVKLIPT